MSDKATTIRIPPKGSRGSRAMDGPAILRPIMSAIMGRQVKKFQGVQGSEPAKFMGFPVLLLTTVGAKTGVERTHVLGGFPDGEGAWLVIASKGGAKTHPQWFINLAKSPDKVWVQIGAQRFKARVESLQGEEREQAYDRVVAVAQNYSGYRTKTDREIPVIRVTRAE